MRMVMFNLRILLSRIRAYLVRDRRLWVLRHFNGDEVSSTLDCECFYLVSSLLILSRHPSLTILLYTSFRTCCGGPRGEFDFTRRKN